METCSFEGCDKPLKARKLCRTHYVQWQRTGKTWVIGTKPHRGRKVCDFPGCGKLVFAHGLCTGHARQRRVGQELQPLRPPRPEAADGYAWCSTCKTFQPVEHFSWDNTRDQPRRVCLDCHRDAMRLYNERPENLRKRRAYRLAKKYGIMESDYLVLWEEQEGRCAACHRPILNLLEHGGDGRHAAAVDHCHDSDAVRGLLCQGCNKGIGCFEEDPMRLAGAIEYLHLKCGQPIEDVVAWAKEILARYT